MSDVQLRPGSRLVSVACTTEVIVINAPLGARIGCGGHPMVAAGQDITRAALTADATEGTQLGKRYVDVDSTVELLCTKPGAGSLSINGTSLSVKAAKLLPSSD